MADEPRQRLIAAMSGPADYPQGRPNQLLDYAPPPTLGGDYVSRRPNALLGYGKGSVQQFPTEEPIGQHNLLDRGAGLIPIPQLRNAQAVARLIHWGTRLGGTIGNLEGQAWFRGEDSPMGTMYRKARELHETAMRRVEAGRILDRMGADRGMRDRVVWEDNFPVSVGPNGEQY
jgi:hypothetical protein